MAIRSLYNIEIKYVKYFLKSYIALLLEKAKSLIPGISRKDVLSVIIPLPPLPNKKP